MNDVVETRKAIERSPSFPFISLEKAVDRARQYYEEEKRSSAAFSVTAEHWGYRPSSSGALQTAAALKSYGLMADEGSGANRKFKLTDLAFRILLDTRPDDTDRKRYMRQAALLPPIVAEIYGKWPDGLPSESSLNHYFVLERGFNQSTAIRSVNIILCNEVLTKSHVQDYKSAYNETSGTEHEMVYSMEQDIIPLSASKPMPIVAGKGGIVRTERVIDPDGLDVLLQFNGEPTLASYNFLKDYIELRIKSMKPADATKTKATAD